MKKLFGSPGSTSGFLLRIGQCLFAGGSIWAMATALKFNIYTAYCYLVVSMGLQVLWSLGLACLDLYALRMKRNLQNPLLLSLFVVGDWVTATLSLAAASSSAGVTVLYARDLDFCRVQAELPCSRFQISVALAFVTWFLVAISYIVMFWLVASI
ncbi:CASP-like protein 5B2 [Macadamia integrifolia]|uniref:CASP-like protein 5B2 n=1 Tax=Macadamia integrifolia TaxID=60698 RepID=UPI001C52AEB3|nr:CASP-like protein 5B2 [Macadamia integrifolia]XP_042476882.1 CASP-like protein 5B2 [Macadamia integrifolia]